MKEKEKKTIAAPSDFAPSAAPEVSALANEAAALDAAAMPAAEDGNAQNPEAAPTVSTADMLRPLLKVTFDLLAPNWKVEEKESAALSDAYAAVLDKYFPDGVVSRWGVEINALLITVAIIGPRIKIPPREVPKENNDQPAPVAVVVG